MQRINWFSLVWGSGLKLRCIVGADYQRLFSLVWGSGLKCFPLKILQGLIWFSLVWGSGLKLTWDSHKMQNISVLPRMREWIEIINGRNGGCGKRRFSLVWGSGLKYHGLCANVLDSSFSLVWGSGLKFPPFRWQRPRDNVLPRMREWIEILSHRECHQTQRVLPRMREWIEI